LTDDSVILDIGANIGVWTINLARQNRQVHCFEPFFPSYLALCGNIFLNKVENNVLVYNCALTNTTDKKLYISNNEANNIGGVMLVEHPEGAEINLKTIDSLNLQRLDFIKVDVEGHEYNVLKGGEETIKKYKPVIFFECWTKESFIEQKNILFDFIIGLGYNIKSLAIDGEHYLDDFVAEPI
jgi:FkbM family methyltransferase